jgi:TRAP-type C4-dicarboxylate transport system permease small subunit
MFINKMPAKVKNTLFCITSWLSTFTLGVMTYATFIYALSMKKVTAMLLIPYKPFVVLMCVALFAFAVALIKDAIKSTIAIWNEDVAKEVESEIN